MNYQTTKQTTYNTPLMKLQKLYPNPSNTILLKLEVVTLLGTQLHYIDGIE